MFLKKIEIQGFKSFADKINIELGMGVTAIVGPNGSGKSNISDAVRWVLGEQSVKSLRGSKMEDVIFSGTEFRKPSGLAEVTLTIDNADGGLQIPYAEVTVTRRVYRSGESEYLINKNQCRLKDVNELFFDTGIGREGYTITGQGRVDEILNNKPEERRGVFEEAAGISKYKARRHEAERRLEATSANLVRIRDIVAELDSQMETLGAQAEVAREYLRLRDELKQIEVAGYVSSIGKYETQLGKCAQGLAAVRDEYDKMTGELADTEAAAARARERAAAAAERRNALNEAVNGIDARLSGAENGVSLSNEKASRARADVERVKGEIARAGERRAGHEAELQSIRKRHGYLSAELARYENLLDAIKGEYEALLNALNESDKAVEKLKQEADAARDKYYDDRNKLSGLYAEKEHYAKTVSAIEKNVSSVAREMDGDRFALEDLGDALAELAGRGEKIHAQLKILSQRRSDAGAALNEQRREAAGLAEGLNAKRARARALRDMENNFEGFFASVRRVLAECARSPDFGAGVCGAVASLINTPKDLETAVAMALGPAQQNIVTEGEREAARAIAFLKRTGGGRATFLPITSIRGRSLDAPLREKLAREPGYIGAASELIGYDPKYTNIINELLGATVIVKKLDDGLAIASKYRHRFRTVTLEGDIISAGGAITGGSVELRDSGILGRRREISELGAAISDNERLAAAAAARMSESEAELADVSRSLSETEKAHNEHQVEKASLTQRRLSLEAKLKTDEDRRDLYKLELGEAAEGRAALSRSIDGLEKSVGAQAEKISEMQADIAAYAEKHREGQQNRDALLADISAYNVSVASVSEARKSSAESIERLEGELADGGRSIASREAAILRFGRDIEKYETEAETLRGEIDKIGQERRGLRLRIESAAAETVSLREEEAALNAEAVRVNGLITGLSRDVGRFETREAKITAELDHCKNRLWEDYELTYHNALAILPAKNTTPAQDEGADAAEAQEPDDQLLNPPLMGEAAAKRSAKIREEIRLLGAVNVLSIDEYAQTKARRELMEKQIDDLDAAGEKLRHIILEMSRVMRKDFEEQFALINKNFDVVFKELFSGGRARLILTEGCDILEAGVEIEIQLPGKRMQNLMLYSGGERALTAIALIFAMLMLKPAPFCLLDEIESALDEANVERFSRYIKKYSDRTQFIMVTHRKGTMEGSGVLYGVTMQERGVSGVVSLRLSDAS